MPQQDETKSNPGINQYLKSRKSFGIQERLFTPVHERKEIEADYDLMIKRIKDEIRYNEGLAADAKRQKDGDKDGQPRIGFAQDPPAKREWTRSPSKSSRSSDDYPGGKNKSMAD